MKDIEEFKTGELITVSEGEHSDYHVNGLFKVLVTFNAQELLVKWVEETKREVVDGKVDSDYTNENIKYLIALLCDY